MNDIMSEASKHRPGEPHVVRAQLDVSRMAGMVCEAARQAALDGVGFTLSAAAARTVDAPDRARDIANQAVFRAAVMQCEIDRFMAIARGRS